MTDFVHANFKVLDSARLDFGFFDHSFDHDEGFGLLSISDNRANSGRSSSRE